jgi:cytochrome c oxidase subunit 3
MIAVMKDQDKRIHPHKFTMWIALASIVMMFAGLTSAYLIKRNLANWMPFDIPLVFRYSTAVIILSSVAIHRSKVSFKSRQMRKYRMWLGFTLLLGILFIVMQYFGFRQLWLDGFTLTRNVSLSFLYIIIGLHALHVIGGVIALLVIFLKASSSKRKVYSPVGIEIMSTYWHFVDFLWLYLFLFLIMIK